VSPLSSFRILQFQCPALIDDVQSVKNCHQTSVIPAPIKAEKAEQSKPGPTISAKAENIRNTGIANSTTNKRLLNTNLSPSGAGATVALKSLKL